MLYRHELRRQRVTANPCDGVALPSGEDAREAVVTTAEALELLAALPDEHDRAVWAVAFFAGLRRGEILALDWSCVDLHARTLKVERGYDPGSRTFQAPKTRKGRRTVGLPALLVPYLAEWQLASGRREGLVFGTDGQMPFRATRLVERSKVVWTDAGLTPIGLHSARHTFVSYCIAAGLNIKQVSEWAGHGSVAITLDRYGHLLPGDREAALAQLDAYHAAATSAATS